MKRWVFLIIGLFLLFFKRDTGIFQSEKTCRQERFSTYKERKQVEGEQSSKMDLPIQQEEGKQETIIENPGSIQEKAKPIRVLLKTDGFQGIYHDHVQLRSKTGISAISSDSGEEIPLSGPEEVLDLGERMKCGEVLRIAPGALSRESGTPAITLCGVKRDYGQPSYEGILEIQRSEQGFKIINEVDLEIYLKYVVPSEMPASYPEESLKAQAVCARTYAAKQMEEGRMKEYGADVDDSVEFQVYNNLSPQAVSTKAVQDTEGLVIRNHGELIQSYFFSTSCGRTSTDEVWGSADPADYLRSISVSGSGGKENSQLQSCSTYQDPGEKSGEEVFREFLETGGMDDYEREEAWYRWKTEIPLRVLEKRAKQIFPHIGKLKNIEVEKRAAGGNAVVLLLEGEKSQEKIYSEYEIRRFLSPEGMELVCQNGAVNTEMKLLPSACMMIDPVFSREGLTGFQIHGGGYGHGVGMSQNGAKCMAQQGMRMEEIIGTFFSNVTIEPYSK